MAASDQTYRSQKALDFVFAGSCVALLLVTIWMFVQDFQRDYKQVQRDFRDVESVMADRAVLDLAPNAEQLDAITKAEEAVAKGREELAKAKADHPEFVRKTFEGKTPQQLLVEKIKTDDAYRGIKADYDSLVSLYDIAVEERNAAISASYSAQLTVQVTSLGAAVAELKKKLDKAKYEADIAKAKYTESEQPLKDAEEALGKKEDGLKKMTQDFDRFAKLAEQKKWGVTDRFRSLPILDAFASPIRIQQYVLNDLPINYSFKFVTRYDRCTTCHMGIEKAAYTQQALEALGPPKTDAQKAQRAALNDKLKAAREAVEKRRASSGGTYTVSPSDIQLTDVPLTPGQVMQYKAHPRLDLYVDGNSPHPGQTFGCSICHAGQGSATDFFNSSHTPNNSEQEAAWMREHHWHSNHYWDFPMLPNRFVESSCVKCHHEMTDLVRDGSRVEAPKLMRGYNLVKDNGCFGCHEIAGIKGGQRVGPDLRLEMSPPLEAYPAAERAKILSDPLNPPGTMRKVGPSLRRISEKTNAEWMARWIRSPRDFRPDTKMPHFYGLSNNHPDILPPDQKDLPDAEIQAIVHYLLNESGAYIKHQDRFRMASEQKQKELQQLVKDGKATEPQLRELDEVNLRLERHAKAAPLPELPAEFNAKATPDQLRHGRELFSERGCLACHINEHTGVPMKTPGKPDLPAIHGDGQFAPNLTRIAAKLGTKPGDEASARRWLVQWISNPSFHFPRTRMPITHLTPEEANDVASWLLSQQVKDWPNAETHVAKPDLPMLQSLATVFLSRAYTRSEVEKFVKEGISTDELNKMGKPLDADERELETTPDFAKSIENKLKMYIGKRAIGQLGCFGCHDIPGFETAKPIGTPLNDWGKKDPERLAFEDVTAYALRNYQIVPSFTEKDGKPVVPNQPVAEGSKKTKELYEKYFFDLLEHHQREGFLYQKLSEPRSYDYQRLRAWDDRLRMPQFRFARAERREKETDEEFAARQQKDEADAREAVMTFIFGLVAEPPPPKFVHHPDPERLAEIKGRQVLEKFNCAGCHLIRPGVYEFQLNDERFQQLQKDHKTAFNAQYSKDYFFPEHNAWAGSLGKTDRIKVFGLRSEIPAREDGQPPDQIVLPSDAVRFAGTDPQGKPALLDIRAYSVAMTIPQLDKLTTRADKFGGTFGDLLAPYLMKKDPQLYGGDEAKPRPAVPPSLHRQGEKTQPLWLFSFLREPFAIRPVTVLRMPKFNMSDEDAMAIVNYFASVSKMDNTGIGLESPYYHSPEREESYIRDQTKNYVEHLGKTKEQGKDKTLLQQRLDEMQPIWEDVLRSQLVDAQSRLRGAEVSVKAAEEDEMKQTDPAKKQEKAEAVKVAKATREASQKAVEEAQARVDKKDFAALRRTWEEKEAYLNDGFKLLANVNVCLKCHSIGNQKIQGAQGPPLDLSHNRLRSDWVYRWLSYPQRFMYYLPTPMPTNFPKGSAGFPDLFHGGTPEQIRATRDALMNYPQVIDLPASRYRPVTVAGGGK